MLKSLYTKRFRKQLELAGKRGLDVDKLGQIMKMIINEQPLPPERHNHPLQGEWKDSLECHIQGDWVLVYEIDDVARKVTFQRTGSHSDLF
jgi:mRNA interferase YafQ